MIRHRFSIYAALVISMTAGMAGTAFSDEKLDGMIKAGEWDKAVKYGEQIPAASLGVDEFVAIGSAYLKLGLKDKALSSLKNAQKANPSDSRVYLGFGEYHLAEKKYQESMEMFQKSYLLNRTAEAADGIARCAMELNQVDKARDAAESAVYLDSGAIGSRLILSDIYMKEKQYKSAAEQLEVIVAARPREVKYWRDLALCYEKTDAKAKLPSVDPAIIDLDKKNVASRRRHVDYLLARGDSAEALVLCKELAVLTPNDAAVFKYLYQLTNAKGDKKDATLYLKNFLVLDSSNASYFIALGNLLYEQKDADGALDAYRKTLRIDPRAKGFYKRYEELVLQKGNEKETVGVINGAINAGEADARSYIVLGDIYKKQKQYAGAIKMYQEALKTDAKNVAVMTSLAQCQAEAGETANAIVTYEQVTMLNADATHEFRELGDLQKKAGKTEQAMESYKKYLKKTPSDEQVAKTVGLYEHGRKNCTEAVKYLEMVKDPARQDIDFLVAAGECYFGQKDYQKAADHLGRAYGQKPSVAVQKRILKSLGESYEKTGKDDRAAEAYEAYTAIPDVRDADAAYLKAYLREKKDPASAVKAYESNAKLYPKDYRNFLRLGLINAGDKTKLPEAAQNLTTASQLVDTLPIIWQTLGEIHGKLKNEDRELASYKKLLTLEPQHLTANRRVGAILMKQGQISPAIANLETALTLDPRNIEVMLSLADGYIKTKRPKDAADMLKKAKELKPDDVDVRLTLIESREAAGQKDLAEKEREDLAELDKKIVAKDARDIEARRRLAAFLLDKKDYNTAFVLYKELAILTPRDAGVFKKLFQISVERKNKNDAVLYLKNYVLLDSTSADVWKTLGNLLYELKDNDGALDAYRAAVRLDPKIKGIYKNYEDIVLSKKLEKEAITVIKGSIAAGEADANSHIALADIYKKQGDCQNAVKMYQEGLKGQPNNMVALTSMAQCQSKAGDVSGAMVTYEQVLMVNNSAVSEIKELGNLQKKSGKAETAIATYKKYLAKKPDDGAIALEVGLHEFGKKQYDEAVRYLELVKEKDLQTVGYLAALGESHYRTKNYAKAAASLANVEGRKPSMNVLQSVLPMLAQSYEKTGEDVKAADAYATYVKIPGVRDGDAAYKAASLREKKDKAGAMKLYLSNTTAYPKDHRNFLRLGILYAEDKATYAKAAAMLSNAAALVDTIPEVWQTQAEIYGSLGNEPKELAAYKKMLTFEPQNLAANRRVGILLAKGNQSQQAIANLETVLAMSPNDVEVILVLADQYLKTKRAQQGIDLLVKAKAYKKDDKKLRKQLYDLYRETGQDDKADAEMRELIKLTNDNKMRLELADNLIKRRKYDDALVLVNEVKAVETENTDVLMLLAGIQKAQKKYIDAIETYKAVSFVKGFWAPALSERGDVYLLMDDTARAKEYFDKALEADSRYGQAYLGLARIAKKKGGNAEYLKLLEKARTLAPNDPEVKEELAKSKK